MPELDTDLLSIHTARRLAEAARTAQRAFLDFTQEQVDGICAAMAEAAYREAERLGQAAVAETTYGRPDHKVVKNQVASTFLWEAIRDVKTVGVVRRDESKRIVEIAWPFGVVAALVPVTNPTSTTIFKILICVKARDAIIVSPHPSAVQCTFETVRVMAEAGERAGMPRGLVSCLTPVALEGTQELMRHWAVDLILATGGSGMVRAAHGVGKPAIGVGPGNVPVYVDRSADVVKAARDLVNSKAFDYSTICSTEQAVIADRPIADRLAEHMKANGAHFLSEPEAAALGKHMFRPDGTMNPRYVGKSPQALAQLGGISVPPDARILVTHLGGIGPEWPLSREKLTPVLGFMVEDGWRKGCERCIEQLKFGGDGHTLVIFARDEEVILAFGLEKPAFRILVNTLASLGAIGYTTNLDPSMTLATGGLGGGVFSDNITVRHVMNLKRLAWGVREWPEPSRQAADGAVTAQQIEEIVRQVVHDLRKG